jgi:ribose transport system ATP-binding protein
MGNQNRKKILEMRNISKAFPGVQALDVVSLDLAEGEAHVLLGENGAGKSTLIKILSGAYRADSGEILFDGRKVEISDPRKGIDLGIRCIYQEYNLNPFTPVYENIFLGREVTNRFRFINFKTAVKETEIILERMGLSISPTILVKHLSVAQKQLVEIAKVVSMNAKIIIFDEPTSALSQDEIANLFQIIRDLKNQNYGIIYISHRLEEIMEIGDRYSVLRDGKMIGEGNVHDMDLAEVIKMMVGREVLYLKRKESYVAEEEVFRVEGICYKDIVKDVSFALRKGEILGVAGLMGSGRTELAKCIIGEYRKDTGRTYLNGKEVQLPNVNTSLKHGIAYLSEDRKGEGLFLKHAVKNNVTISNLDRILSFGFLNFRKESNACSRLVSELSIKTPHLRISVGNLSGGNQQKVVIAKWLMTMARIFIFDEPTRGIDVGAKEEIHKLMISLLEQGASIIMISSQIPEILNLSDRVLVMRQGRVATILDNIGADQEEIFRYEAGVTHA